MNQETLVRPERYVKVCMAAAVLSLITIAVCQVILVLRPSPQPVMRRQMVPMENPIPQMGQPPFPPGIMPPGMQPGQGTPEGSGPKPPPQPGQVPGQPAKK